MRIAFAYGRYALGGKQLDMADPFSSPSGLTGSELSCLCFAREMKRNGHDVTLYLPRRRPFDILESLTWEGVWLRESSFLKSENHDVVCAWNEPDLLRGLDRKTLRICNQQLNDFWYAADGYDQYVDVYTSPSESHRLHLRDQTCSPNKWQVLPNGCEPGLYNRKAKVSGRVIYASSPDRGLHQLCRMWPEIRRRVPKAHLRIFYNLGPWLQMSGMREADVEPRHRESRKRAIDVLSMLPTLEGVEVVGSVSRSRMVLEMSQAQVLAYPCDPYTWTEGFSVTTMEACAAGCVPVITDADALGEIYGEVVPMVRRYACGRMDVEGYMDLVVRALTDAKWRKKVTNDTIRLAEGYAWPLVADRLERIIRAA